METCFNYTNKERAYFSTDERKFISKVRRLKEQFPDEVRIIAEPEENDGCLYCELPTAWFTVRVPKKMNLTDEQREQIAKRFAYAQIQRQYKQKTGQKSLPQGKMTKYSSD